ncbi:MAG: 50S ribosomal protein L3 [Holophagales bacterium]|jgi:large subunit ribosomal protein L3|nr:50S ribosomal protein L3 [Holophagales bacterium]
MANGIIGKKLGMTQIFNEKGQVVPVTVIQAGPCVVVQRKTVNKDGYDAVQIGFVDVAGGKRASRPEKGHCEKHGVAPVRVLREMRVDAESPLKEGDNVLVNTFQESARVHVTGVSKGKGFAGVVKRHHFSGGRASHGSMFHRAPGSIGGSSDPSRVFPGIRMGGHMGAEQVTVRNLEVARVDVENNLLLIKGAVPGPRGGYVVIRQEA